MEKNVAQCKHNFVLNVFQPQLAEPAEVGSHEKLALTVHL